MTKIPDILNSLAVRVTVSAMILLQLVSCQKVVDVDLNDAAPRIVIEGMITDQAGPYFVTITKSGSFFEMPQLVMVSGATVKITDDTGLTDKLREVKPGIYRTSSTRGRPGRTYKLDVIAEGEEYSATSTMPAHVAIDSLVLRKEEFHHIDIDGDGADEQRVEIRCFFRDPAEKNFYRIRYSRNDTLRTDVYRLYDDEYTNGEITDMRVGHAHGGNFYKVELFSLNRQVYGYYLSLQDLLYSDPVFGYTPANPEPVFTNGALGYFGASAVDSRIIAVTKAMIDKVK